MADKKDGKSLPAAKRLSGRQVCAAFDIRGADLRALCQRGVVHPVRASDRSLHYDPGEVRAALGRGIQGAPTGESRQGDGDVAADVFKLFIDGKSLPEVVVSARQTPERVNELRRSFDAMSGAMVLPAMVVSQAANELGLERLPAPDQIPSLLRKRLQDAFLRGRQEADDENTDFGEVLDPATGQLRKVKAG